MSYAVREALAAFRRAPLLTGLSATMIALSLLVIGLFALAAYNVRQVIQRVESRVQVVAYLRDDANPTSVQVALEQIAEFREVDSVRYVTPEQALEQARQELPEFEAVFGTLDTNPLPASLEIALRPGLTDGDVVRDVARRLELYPFVEEVRFGSDWLDKVYVLRRVAGATTLILGGGFALIAAIIIGAAVRMAVFARSDEIAIMRQVGATDGFVRRPFVLEGLMTGLIGAFFAVAATRGIYELISRNVFRLEWIPTGWLLAGLISGALVGVIAAAIAVRRHLAEIA